MPMYIGKSEGDVGAARLDIQGWEFGRFIALLVSGTV